MQSHLPSCWAELYLTAWWPPSFWPLAPPFGLVRPVRFEPGSAWPGGTPKATTARARKVLERVLGLLAVGHPGANDAPVTLRAMGGNEVGPPHPQLPGLQGGEVAFPGAGRAVATPSSRTWATLGPILRPGRVRSLGRRQNLELNALDRRHLPDPPIIELPLLGRGPNALGQGLASLSAWSFPFRPSGEMRSESSFSWGGTQRTRTLPSPSADKAFLYRNHKPACLEVGLILPPALIRSASSTTPLQSETTSTSPRKTSRATWMAKSSAR